VHPKLHVYSAVLSGQATVWAQPRNREVFHPKR
jgi:hypothetical protein